MIMNKDAVLSPCRLYRYELSRVWETEGPLVLFIGLNPSTADEMHDDHTIRRCIGYAKDWGMGGLMMGNLFAYRATDPKVMKQQYTKAIGPDNDEHLFKMAASADLIVGAWGSMGWFLNRGRLVREMFPNMKCLTWTKNGEPHHPLRLRKDLVPIQLPRLVG